MDHRGGGGGGPIRSRGEEEGPLDHWILGEVKAHWFLGRRRRPTVSWGRRGPPSPNTSWGRRGPLDPLDHAGGRSPLDLEEEW